MVALAALATSCVALAQSPGGSARPTPYVGKSGLPPGMARGESRVAGPTLAELVKMRISQLEEDLNLRPGQLPAWIAYRDRVLRMLEDQRRSLRGAANETTAPRRLDALADMARNRLAAAEEIVDAGKALYAVLSVTQREVADRRLALPLATLTGQDAGADLRPRPMPGARGGEATTMPLN